jgi:hypothetical protein
MNLDRNGGGKGQVFTARRVKKRKVDVNAKRDKTVRRILLRKPPLMTVHPLNAFQQSSRRDTARAFTVPETFESPSWRISAYIKSIWRRSSLKLVLHVTRYWAIENLYDDVMSFLFLGSTVSRNT